MVPVPHGYALSPGAVGRISPTQGKGLCWVALCSDFLDPVFEFLGLVTMHQVPSEMVLREEGTLHLTLLDLGWTKPDHMLQKLYGHITGMVRRISI